MAIVSTNPTHLATNVVRNVALKANFSDELDRRSVTDLTVLLLKSSDRSVVSGVVDYIPGTRSITFQLSQLLEKNTSYTWILVGRTEGIKTLASVAALPGNQQVVFTTGEGIDNSLPLAPATTVAGGIQPFAGGQGLYTVVFGQTGEPISHVVTTAGQVGPSGDIVPAPYATSVYLAASGSLEPTPITISGTFPAANDAFLGISALTTITIGFDQTPPVNAGLTNGGVDLLVEDLLQLDVTQPTWTTTVTDNKLVVTPSEWLAGAKYTITVSRLVRGPEVGSDLGEDYVFSFTTKPVLYFTTVRLVRINLGAAISKITDEDIQLLIYENSKWAFDNDRNGFSEDDPPIYVKEYVLCKTKLDTMNLALMGTDAPVRERIGEVEFHYGSNLSDRFKTKMKELQDCIADNELLILNGGTKATMITATKALNAPGRPGMPQTWRRINDNGSFPTKNAGGQ